MAELRLADILAALSQVTDLGMGQPPETAVHSCLVATALARHMGVPERDVSAIYYVTLLQHVGCTAYAHETAAALGGDDIAVRRSGASVDFGNTRESMAFLFLALGSGKSPLARAQTVYAALRQGPAFDRDLASANCESAVHAAARMGLDAEVQRGLNEIYERADGKGNPGHLAGSDVALAARFAQVASQAVLWHGLGGPDLAREVVRRRAGGMLDREFARAFGECGADLLMDADAADASVAVVELEPEPHRTVPESGIDAIAGAFGDMSDLKSPFLHGHSAGVSRLAATAASHLGLPAGEQVAVRRAGSFHDLGRVGVASGVWDKPGPLTTAEWEQVRLHPYHSERILARSHALSPLARLAGLHHERLDGSGYHRQATAAAIPMAARLLSAADAYQAMSEERPYRPALAPAQRVEQLTAEVELGRLDTEAVRAVLAVAGEAPALARIAGPAGLTEREVQVLRLAARGKTIREIAGALFISPKTADHHVQHIYAKIGVSTRAGAALFAMEHDLLQEEPPPDMG